MKRKIMPLLSLLIAISMLYAVSSVFAEEYESLKGVQSAKVIIDERESNPQTAVLHLKLLSQTFKDLEAMNNHPVFVVIFSGLSVKLISKNREGFPPEDQKSLDEIASTLSEMSKNGITLEMCLVAAKVFNVDPASVLPEIKRVGNGWISMIGYQAQGYSLVPIY
jgi:intracellular sulfur oxidation DsrE/DsrF family protein